MKKSVSFILAFLSIGFIFSQWNYRVEIIAESFENLPALHSYAMAQSQNDYLIIGGRKDGIHPRQPFAAFDETDKNTRMYVINPVTKQVWGKDLNGLNAMIVEQLSSTNMNFHQVEDTLFIVGGYGYSTTAADHKTYEYLTTISVDGIINAIKNQSDISAFIKQIKFDKFAVTGGHLTHMNKQFYLVGGHRFDGRYNPMGHSTYTQEYTHEVRIFKINNSGNNPVVYDYSAIHDENHLRRRDYNLVPQIFPNGKKGFLISSGVFQKGADLPFLYPVQIHDTTITAITDFNQYLSNYHSASVALYDTKNKDMHSLFLGGLSQYNYENEKLIKDDLVPFVKTISLVTQSKNGDYSEYKLNESMPALLGSGAEFLTNPNLPRIDDEIIDLNSINTDSVVLGYVFGGIRSEDPNPFANNNISQTMANPVLYKVRLIKDAQADTRYLQQIPDVKVYPNPNETGNVNVSFPFSLSKAEVYIYNSLGVLLQESHLDQQSDSQFKFTIDSSIPAQMLFVQIKGDDGQIYRKTIVYKNLQ